MKTLFKSLKITLAFCVFFSVFYILILWIFAQVAGPNKGNAEVATLDGKVVGAANVGQMFTKDIYFWGRPSHAGDGYDATSSSGSRPYQRRISFGSRSPYRYFPRTPSLSEP